MSGIAIAITGGLVFFSSGIGGSSIFFVLFISSMISSYVLIIRNAASSWYRLSSCESRTILYAAIACGSCPE